jgi:hypothetical protein
VHDPVEVHYKLLIIKYKNPRIPSGPCKGLIRALNANAWITSGIVLPEK